MEHIPDQKSTVFPVKNKGLEILDLTQTENGNYSESCVVTRHLVAALRGLVKFLSEHHTQILTYGRNDIRRQKVQENE